MFTLHGQRPQLGVVPHSVVLAHVQGQVSHALGVRLIECQRRRPPVQADQGQDTLDGGRYSSAHA
jgi:hypothetical protein